MLRIAPQKNAVAKRAAKKPRTARKQRQKRRKKKRRKALCKFHNFQIIKETKKLVIKRRKTMILQANKEKASDFKRRRTQIILREKERDTFQSKQNEKSSREVKKSARNEKNKKFTSIFKQKEN